MRRVAVLGTGIMGAGMARTLLRAGLGVKVWNRSPGRAEPLAADGAHVTGTAAEAPAGVLWAQTSAASPHDAGGRPPALAGSRGARTAARRGHTTVRCHRRRTVWASERPADGTRLKLVANSWAGTVMAATAQAIALAQGLGLDPRAFLDTVRGGAADTPFLRIKGQAMIAGQFPAAFTVDGAVKDTRLIADAMRQTGTDATLIDAVAQQYRKAADSGHGGKDMAAVIRAFRQ